MGNTRNGVTGLVIIAAGAFIDSAEILANRPNSAMLFALTAGIQLLLMLLMESRRRRSGVARDISGSSQTTARIIKLYVIPLIISGLIAFASYLYLHGTLPISIGFLIVVLLYVSFRPSGARRGMQSS